MDLEEASLVDVFDHCMLIPPVQEHLPKQPQRLPQGHILVSILEQSMIAVEEGRKVLNYVLVTHLLFGLPKEGLLARDTSRNLHVQGGG